MLNYGSALSQFQNFSLNEFAQSIIALKQALWEEHQQKQDDTFEHYLDEWASVVMRICICLEKVQMELLIAKSDKFHKQIQELIQSQSPPIEKINQRFITCETLFSNIKQAFLTLLYPHQQQIKDVISLDNINLKQYSDNASRQEIDFIETQEGGATILQAQNSAALDKEKFTMERKKKDEHNGSFLFQKNVVSVPTNLKITTTQTITNIQNSGGTTEIIQETIALRHTPLPLETLWGKNLWDVSFFSGRADLLATYEKKLKDNCLDLSSDAPNKVVVFHGVPGVGKSALALALADKLTGYDIELTYDHIPEEKDLKPNTLTLYLEENKITCKAMKGNHVERLELQDELENSVKKEIIKILQHPKEENLTPAQKKAIFNAASKQDKALRPGYKHVIWISAQTPEDIKRAYIELANTVQPLFPTISIAEILKDSKQWLERVNITKTWCAQNRVLLIFDGVYDAKSLDYPVSNSQESQSFIPGKGVSILLTTCCTNWHKEWIKEQIVPFTNEEAEACLTQMLPQYVQDGSNNNNINTFKELATLSRGLPLLIAQMGHFIKKNTMDIKKFQMRFQENPLLFLKEPPPEAGTQHPSFYETWRRRLEQMPPEARLLLRLSVKMSPPVRKSALKKDWEESHKNHVTPASTGNTAAFFSFPNQASCAEKGFLDGLAYLKQYSFFNSITQNGQGETYDIHEISKTIIDDLETEKFELCEKIINSQQSTLDEDDELKEAIALSLQPK